MPKLSCLFHYLDKPEHLVRSFVMSVFDFFGRGIRVLMIFAEEFNRRKSAFVDVKMDVPLFKIGRAGLPDLGFGVQGFNFKPCAVADALAMFLRGSEKDLEMIVICFFVDLEDDTANGTPLIHNSVCFVLRIVDTALDGFARDYLSVLVNMIVAESEFLHSAEFEGFLIVKDELLAVVFTERYKGNFCVFHVKPPENKNRAPA